MKIDILDALERFLETILKAFAAMGLFLFINFLVNLFSDITLGFKEHASIFTLSFLIVYWLSKILMRVRYEKLELMADALENMSDEDIELYEHLRRSVDG